jgi:signal transduction histidine kinase/type II secretory pathway pseudopilin PulG
MQKTKYKFESEVHLGLLMIVLLLICVSAVSNFVVFKARTNLQEQTTGRLQAASVAISRALEQSSPAVMSDDVKTELAAKYRLTALQVIPFKPPDESIESRRQWFAHIVGNLPPAQMPALVNELLGSDFRHLTRGAGSEYFLVSPLPQAAGNQLIILSTNVPDLAFLEDSANAILWTGAGTLVFVAILYLLLSRFIFRPFRRIKEHANLAGRKLPDNANDADLVVSEYKQIIKELQDKEAELVQLNASIQTRADSLEQFNQYLLSSIESGIVTLDNDGNIKTLNDAAGRILNIDPVASLGKSFGQILADRLECLVLLRRALSSQQAVPYQEIRHNDGNSIRTYGVAVSFVRDSHRLPVGVSMLINDLTEVSELRSRLETKNRLEALGEMSGGLAHQLRNSVGAINGFAALVRRRIAKDEKATATEGIDQLLQESQEAEALIAKFLNFAKPFDFSPRLIRVSEPVREVIASFRSREETRQISFRFDGTYDGTIMADPLLMKQAITNLIENAVLAYEGKPGSVVVSIRPQGERLTLCVTDSASGIAPDKLDKIFTPFYSSRPSGTGLGLPLAARIIDLHGGQIQVESTLGKGTTFRIELPVIADQMVNSI